MVKTKGKEKDKRRKESRSKKVEGHKGNGTKKC